MTRTMIGAEGKQKLAAEGWRKESVEEEERKSSASHALKSRFFFLDLSRQLDYIFAVLNDLKI